MRLSRVWLLILSRRWHAEFTQLLLLVTVSGVTGAAVFRTAAQEPVHASIIGALALLMAMTVPRSSVGTHLFGTLRLDLLPMNARTGFLMRLLLLHPLRVVLAASAVLWTAAALLHMTQTPPVRALELLQVLALACSALLLAQLADDLPRPRTRAAVQAALGAAGTLALLMLVVYSELAPSLALLAPADTAPLRHLLLGSAQTSAAEMAATTAAAAVLGMTVLLVLVGTRRTPVPPRPHTQRSAGGRVAGRAARLLLPGASALLRKEYASVLRHARLSLGLIWPALFTAVAVNRGVPLLITAAYPLWSLQTLNLLGPDVPLGGLRRYRLLPVSLARTFTARHGAILALITAVVAVTAVVVVLAGAAVTPRLGPATFAMYPLAAVYGATMYLAAAAVGERVATRYPFWFDSARRRLGEEPPVLVVMPALITMIVAVLLSLALAAAVVGAAMPSAAAVWRGTALLGAASLLQLALHGAARVITPADE